MITTNTIIDLATIIQIGLSFFILLLLVGGYVASFLIFRNQSSGQYQLPCWWPMSVYFESKAPPIFYTKTILCVSLIFSNFFIFMRKSHGIIMFQCFLISSAITYTSMYSFLLFKAKTLPDIVRDTTFLKACHVIATSLTICSPFITYWFLDTTIGKPEGDTFDPLFKIMDEWGMLWWGIYHACMVSMLYFLFLKPLAMENQNPYLKPIITENAIIYLSIVLLCLALRWIIILAPSIRESKWSVIIFQSELWILLLSCIYSTRWGWRNIHEKNKKRGSSAVVERKSTLGSETKTIEKNTPTITPTFELCLFPRHRRSMSMTHVDFKHFSQMSIPRKTCSLNIPV